jgi:hypothetical protein
MSDKSIYREQWGSGIIASDREATGSPQFEDPHILDRRTVRTQKFGTLTHRQFQQYLTESRKSYVLHSDGFLSLSHIRASAYTCKSCGFNGVFNAKRCARCKQPIHNKRKHSHV